MTTVLLPLQPGTLPIGACYLTEQARLNAYAENLQAQLPGQAFFNYGDSVPDVSNNAYPWLRTTDGLWYQFSGSWISPVGPAYDLSVRRLWVGSLFLLRTYDGGDTDPASDRSGPMWVEDTDFQGRSPMGPGAISGSDPAKTLAVVENHGAGANTLVSGNVPEHLHAVKYSTDTSGTGFPTVGDGSTHDKTFNTELSGGSATPTPINNVHPVRGCYIIKWSGRLYRKAS